MQANREMCFQKNCAKPMRIGWAFINAFIANAVGDGSWRISGLVDTAHHAIGNGIVSTVISAAIRLPVESITLPAHRVVSDVAGDGAMAALIVVIETKAAKAFGTKGIADSRLKPSRKIAAGYRNVNRNGFDSPDAEGIAEHGGKMMRMASIIWNPYIWYVGTCDKIADAFSYLITNLKTVTAYGMENRPIHEIPTDSIWDTAMGYRAICVSGYRACRHDRTGSGSRRSPNPAISSVPSSPRAGSSASSCVSASMRRIAAAHM